MIARRRHRQHGLRWRRCLLGSVVALVSLVLLLSSYYCYAEHDADADELPQRNFSVVAYLPEWRDEGANWEVISQYTTHLILFSLEMDPTGRITALDRLPRPELLEEARRATRKHGTKLLACFGGNGRSSGFPAMVQNPQARHRFVQEQLVALCVKYDLDGVDFNWEYPGYDMRRGRYDEHTLAQDYEGFAALLRDTHSAFAKQQRTRSSPLTITMAYYPDGRQEELILKYGLHHYADLMHAMSYDHRGKHSTFEHCTDAIQKGRNALLPPEKLTVGLPFYGRETRTGNWKSYEDIVQQYAPLTPDANEVVDGKQQQQHNYYFNGPKMIERKTTYALEHGLGGVMIWEAGQDCRLRAVTHGDTTHVVTCPEGDDSSLLMAIDRAIVRYYSRQQQQEQESADELLSEL